ncbi:MAG: serine hydrolase domain-containing protein [Acidobacteriota bacterium]
MLKRHRLDLLLCLLLTSSSTLTAQEPFEELDEWLAPLAATRDLAGHLVVLRPGQPAFQQSWGKADLDQGLDNDGQTRFGVGSITKQFTAAATLGLVAEGRLELDWALARWFPKAGVASAITLEQLLGHRSGLVRDVPPGPSDDLATVAEDIFREPLTGTPGESVEYSNSGYVVLAAVLERVTGQSFEALVSERLLAPLRLESSGFRQGPRRRLPAIGYDPGFGPRKLQVTPAIAPRRNLGASGLVTSAGDLARWTKALHEGGVLDEAELRRMTEDQGGGRGYGTGLYRRSGRPVIGHDGVENGYVAFAEYYPESRTAVAFAGNVRTSAYEAVETGVGRLLAGRELPSLRRPATTEGARDPSLVGRYRVHPSLVLEVLDSPDGLQLMGTGGYPTPLERIEGDRWFYRALFAEVQFQRPAASSPPKSLLWIDVQGRRFEVPRDEDARPLR